MSNSCWIRPLKRALENLAAPNKSEYRIAILGIGNELNGDDAAGVETARRLLSLLPRRDNLLIIDAGPAPENFTGPLRRFRPDLVIMIDAAEMGEAPGSVAWHEWQAAVGFSASSHTLPPSVLAEFLVHELGCQVAMLLVQAGQLEFTAPMSKAVDAAVTELVTRIGEFQRSSP